MNLHSIIIWISNFFLSILCQAKFLQCHVFILASSHIFMVTSSLGSALVLFLNDYEFKASFNRIFPFRYIAGQHMPTLRKKCCPAKLLAVSPWENTLFDLFSLPFTWLLLLWLLRPCPFLGTLCPSVVQLGSLHWILSSLLWHIWKWEECLRTPNIAFQCSSLILQ